MTLYIIKWHTAIYSQRRLTHFIEKLGYKCVCVVVLLFKCSSIVFILMSVCINIL